MTAASRMALGLFIRPAGFSVAAWRHPGSRPDANVTFGSFVDIARTAERGGFALDGLVIRRGGNRP